MPYPTLDIAVVDVDLKTYFPPTLAEAMMHFRSTVGSQLFLDEEIRVLQWDGDKPRAKARGGRAALSLKRRADGTVAVDVSVGPYPSEEDATYDYTRDNPLELVGRSRVIAVTLDMSQRP